MGVVAAQSSGQRVVPGRAQGTIVQVGPGLAVVVPAGGVLQQQQQAASRGRQEMVNALVASGKQAIEAVVRATAAATEARLIQNGFTAGATGADAGVGMQAAQQTMQQVQSVLTAVAGAAAQAPKIGPADVLLAQAQVQPPQLQGQAMQQQQQQMTTQAQDPGPGPVTSAMLLGNPGNATPANGAGQQQMTAAVTGAAGRQDKSAAGSPGSKQSPGSVVSGMPAAPGTKADVNASTAGSSVGATTPALMADQLAPLPALTLPPLPNTTTTTTTTTTAAPGKKAEELATASLNTTMTDAGAAATALPGVLNTTVQTPTMPAPGVMNTNSTVPAAINMTSTKGSPKLRKRDGPNGTNTPGHVHRKRDGPNGTNTPGHMHRKRSRVGSFERDDQQRSVPGGGPPAPTVMPVAIAKDETQQEVESELLGSSPARMPQASPETSSTQAYTARHGNATHNFARKSDATALSTVGTPPHFALAVACLIAVTMF
ncbi:hypothetical protein PYCC9005_002020 [Savitreella phatthalungensis]